MSKALRLLQNNVRRAAAARCVSAQVYRRQFHSSPSQLAVKQLLLADIGEGITECQLIQWFVQEGARVEQFDKLCEVQSDKASVEITSSYDGVIKKLHYNTDDMAITGKPLVDIDVVEDVQESGEVIADTTTSSTSDKADVVRAETVASSTTIGSQRVEGETATTRTSDEPASAFEGSKIDDTRAHLQTLATPAVRHLMRELKVDITQVRGTGRDGRVLKEDVHKHANQRSELPARLEHGRQVSLTPVQQQMFKTMTRSLSIPHFLYTTSVDMSQVTELRNQLNSSEGQKITAFAVILKAVSVAFKKYEILNAGLSTTSDKPTLTYHAVHNFGIAVDTPGGLVVPVLPGVQSLSIDEIAAGIHDLSARARDRKLSPSDFQDATFTVSNIGSIGGGIVSPVISEPQVAILGIGRSRIVPAFGEKGELRKKEELVLSWSADHRVVDGATCARCAESVRQLLEKPATMIRAMT